MRHSCVLLVALACVVLRSAAAAGAPLAGESDVVFVSSGSVTIADPLRSGQLRLALPGYATDVTPSPDGSLLAYEAVDSRSNTRFAVVDRRTGRRRWGLASVAVFERPEWAPVGLRFAFSTYGELWLGGASRRNLRLVADDYNSSGFEWSPDGRELAFGSRHGLIVFDVRSRRRAVLVRGPGARSPAWSSDGASLAYIRGARLYVVDAAGRGRPQRLARNVRLVAWSPDGLQLAYLKDGNLFIAGRSGTPVPRLIGRNVVDFDWSPDSRRLAFSSRTPLHTSIFIVGRGDAVGRRVTFPATPNNDRSPLWSPDGMQIVYERSARGISRVYVIDGDGTHERPILEDDLESEACGCSVSWLNAKLRLPAPAPLVPFRPTTEITSGSSVAGLAVDGGQVAALLSYGISELDSAWESKLWSPVSGQQAGAEVRCDDTTNTTSDEVNGPALAGNRYAYLCSEDLGDTRLYTATTEQPQSGVSVLDEPYGAHVTVAGAGSLLVATVNGDLIRLDADGGLTPLQHYPQYITALGVDQNRVLLALSSGSLQIVADDGTAFSPLSLPHGSGAVLSGSQLVTLDRGTVAVHDLNGQTLLTRKLPIDAALQDVAGSLVLYTTHSRLHLLRLQDDRSIALELPGQISRVSAGFTADGALVVGYSTPNERPGTIAYLQADRVEALLAARTEARQHHGDPAPGLPARLPWQ
jgi:Tol biopolymer transport system component